MDKYFKFDGLASRSEYWGVQLIGFGLFMLSMFVSGMLGTFVSFLGVLAAIASIVAYIWIVLATVVRRCKDAGINPWWTVAIFLPYIGFIPWIVIGVLSTAKNEQT